MDASRYPHRFRPSKRGKVSTDKRAVRLVDARGALCPVPTVMTALALEAGSDGCAIDVWADDPVTRRDLPLWCVEFGHQVVSIKDSDSGFIFRIQKGSPGGKNR